MIRRPRPKLAVWAALAIVGAAYITRSVVIRGGDFRPDLPLDALVAVLLLAALGLVAWMRNDEMARERVDNSAEERDSEHGQPGD